MNVGFYYMANAGGHLVGTLLSGLDGCRYGTALFTLVAARLSLKLK